MSRSEVEFIEFRSLHILNIDPPLPLLKLKKETIFSSSTNTIFQNKLSEVLFDGTELIPRDTHNHFTLDKLEDSIKYFQTNLFRHVNNSKQMSCVMLIIFQLNSADSAGENLIDEDQVVQPTLREWVLMNFFFLLVN